VIGAHETAGRSHHAHQNADSRPGIVSLSRKSNLSLSLFYALLAEEWGDRLASAFSSD
jgi:hypothetical protein